MYWNDQERRIAMDKDVIGEFFISPGNYYSIAGAQAPRMHGWSGMQGQGRGLTNLLRLSLVVLVLLMVPGCSAKEEPYVTLARCRSNCVRQYLPVGKYSDKRCWDARDYGVTNHCEKCWTACKALIASTFLQPECQKETSIMCADGCKTACVFIEASEEASVLTDARRWEFDPDEIQTLSDYPIEMDISWAPPHLVSEPGPLSGDSLKGSENGRATGALKRSQRPVEPIVYVLLYRDASMPDDGWTLMQEQVSTAIRISLESLPETVEFLLQAVSQDGLIAQTEFQPNSIIYTSTEHARKELVDQLKESEEPTWQPIGTPGLKLNMTFTTARVQGHSGAYTTQSAEVRFLPPARADTTSIRTYTLTWIFEECVNDFDDYRCQVTNDYLSATVPLEGNEEATYTIKDLRFNSIYMLNLVAESEHLHDQAIFITSACHVTDQLRQTQCLDEIEEEHKSDTPIVKPGYGSDGIEEDMWANVSSMLLIPESNLVLVNVTWMPPTNESAALYNVTTLLSEEHSMVVNTSTTRQPYLVLRLMQDTQYLLRVTSIPTFSSSVSDNTEAFLQSAWLHINTSEAAIASHDGPQAYRVTNADKVDPVNGIIIGVSCGLLLLGLLLLGGLLYMKRKKFKDIIVTKAAVAKSNSYKSNVGSKSDYSNQLIVFSDDWELDPARLKFSTLLGQGAFGKVVTGYFEDQKVAIKLVREGAPISYKEDLVAEINLMKRLGTHPNIVCLIGACTLNEPIALVMEYVPYGNLQNFLKKCRQEGDLQKRADGPSEITYTVVQDNGDMESGMVTPADMLSFARQVSMAMEYLTEKRYVHRDLAARNVLIDYNKVVKVCDFGLSRDIFNDNHYKKLTNGKLPLKWMAIESLRDRIFTTQSDVWSFGILFWEIVTMGASPYPNVALADLYYVLSNGYRMDRPSNCSVELYTIMRSCWQDEPTERPTFTQLRFMLEELLTEDRDYLVLEDIDVPLTNSDNSSNPLPDNAWSEQELGATAAAPMITGSFPGASTSSSSQPSGALQCKPKKSSPRKDTMRINVCIHQKSTDRLIRPSESDSSPSY